ncbi:MAG: hypothetical protein ACJAWV_003720 [Flammeovirgaceae bacterium]
MNYESIVECTQAETAFDFGDLPKKDLPSLGDLAGLVKIDYFIRASPKLAGSNKAK